MRYLDDGVVRLRAVEPRDAEMMWEIETDSTQWRENGMMAPYSLHNLKKYAENYDADPIHAGQIRLVAEGESEILGLADLYDINPQNRTAFIGIYILPSRRRLGFATRSVALLEKYAKELLNLRVLAAKVAERNKASENLFIKAGFTQVGTLKNWILTGTTTQSLNLFEKLIF